MTNLICIVCPKGCHLSVDEEHDYNVTGFGCPRGQAYGKKELVNPTRVVTSTVKIQGALHHRCPVKTNGDIPKSKIFDAMKLLDSVELVSPVHVGDVVVKDVCGTGVDFVSAKNM
jgi:CxxC motif-containing protein